MPDSFYQSLQKSKLSLIAIWVVIKSSQIKRFYGFRSSLQTSELYIFDIWNDNLQSFNRGKNEASVPVFYADWTSVPVPRTSSLRGLDVGFIPLLPKELPYMANNDEYNDEYLCRDFFAGFNFCSRLSFQISEFQVHCFRLMTLR